MPSYPKHRDDFWPVTIRPSAAGGEPPIGEGSCANALLCCRLRIKRGMKNGQQRPRPWPMASSWLGTPRHASYDPIFSQIRKLEHYDPAAPDKREKDRAELRSRLGSPYHIDLLLVCDPVPNRVEQNRSQNLPCFEPLERAKSRDK
jgi:hypothetical protein